MRLFGQLAWKKTMVYKKFFTSFLMIALSGLCLASVTDCQSCSDENIIPEQGYITTADSVRLFYQKIGVGEQKVLIPGHFLLYDDFKHLAEDKTLVFYDMRNRGNSKPVYDRNKISIHHDIRDLEEVRNYFGFDKVGLVGYSYLGKMVAMYAYEYPENVERVIQLGPVSIEFGTQYPDSLTANDAAPVIDEQALNELREKREQNFHLTHPEEYCEEEWQVTRIRLIGNPDNLQKMGKSHCSMPNEWPINLARHFSAHFVSMQEAPFTPTEVAELNIPVLTIHGTKDRNSPFGSGKEWAFHLPEARLVTVSGAAHRSWIDEPELVFDSVKNFLNGKWPQKAVTIH